MDKLNLSKNDKEILQEIIDTIRKECLKFTYKFGDNDEKEEYMRLANEEIHKYMPSIKYVTIELKDRKSVV